MKRNDTFWWRWSLIALTILLVPALIQVSALSKIYPQYLTSFRFKFILFGLVGFFLVFHLFTWVKGLNNFAAAFLGKVRNNWFINLVVIVVLGCYVYYVLFMDRGLIILFEFWVWLVFSAVVIFLCGWMFRLLTGEKIWFTTSMTALGIGIFQEMVKYIPCHVAYPFTTNWSETSWFYYASFFFSKKIYGMSIPWPFLDIGKPLLLSAAYLIPDPPIWLIRVWQSVLWLGSAFLVAILLKRRLQPGKSLSVIIVFWGFMWMLLGPVFYHLSLSVAAILWGFERKHFWRTVFWVVLASLWTGILRINWVPMPSILAISLYLLETPLSEREKIIKYLQKPFFYAVWGLGAGIASFLGYLFISGKADTRVGTKFSAPFLLDRLWPNATLATGIIPGILLVSLILVIIIYLSWRALRYHALRTGLLLVMLTILLVGGIIASIRIGGGNNLHNLDACLVLLMLWGGYALAGKIQSERSNVSFTVPGIAIFLLCVTPVLWGWQSFPSFSPKNMTTAYQELDTLKQLVQIETEAQGKPVLFVYQRHLITFDYIDTPLITEYELEELSEMANSGNAEYFEQFYEDLENHKYSLIVLDNSQPEFKTTQTSFSEENNAWVEYVLIPLAQYYQSVLVLPQSGTKVYAPIP